MTCLQTEIVQDLIYMENDLGNPTFAWNGGSYPFVPSISSFTRDLEEGGYYVQKMMTSTVRILNRDGSYQFPSNTLPTAQQKITYSVDGQVYRIDSVKIDPTGSHFRMIAVSPFRGI